MKTRRFVGFTGVLLGDRLWGLETDKGDGTAGRALALR